MTSAAPMKDAKDLIRGRRLVVTGAVGSLGPALVRRLLACEPEEIRLFDNNESELHYLAEAYASSNIPVHPYLGDVRDGQKLRECFSGTHIVFHAAALKHVPLCERHPMEAVQTNIFGVQNVIASAIDTGVERIIQTSSDKAVNPTSVMGASKLMAEKLVNAANVGARRNGQVFASIRFGNVLGSRGSVVPIFAEQIRRGGPVTLTDPDMTRFVMTPEEAVQLIVDATALAVGGDVLICKMLVVRIADLAAVMVEELAPSLGRNPKDIEIRVVGPRPGEKMYEELMNSEETRRSVELERHFAILPALFDIYGVQLTYPNIQSQGRTVPYTSDSEKPMDRAALRSYLREFGIIERWVKQCAS